MSGKVSKGRSKTPKRGDRVGQLITSDSRPSSKARSTGASESDRAVSALSDISCISVPAASVTSSRIQHSRILPELEFEGARHILPERLPSARPDRTVTLRLAELSDDNLEHLFSLAGSLKRLDLSGTRLFAFPKELVERLTCIERLLAGNNELTADSFPDNFIELTTLKEISIPDNELKEIPKCWHSMKRLSRINVEGNMVENLKGLEYIRRMKCLVANYNKLSSLHREFYTMKRLEYVYLSHNKISNVFSQIKYLTNLREVDLSYNKLHSICADIFLLPNLEHLNACNNYIGRIPTLNLKGRSKQKVAAIDLSNNQLTRFPEQLMRIAEKLDLSNNRIKVVPSSTLKRVTWRTAQELDISNNPITSPPRDICDEGLRSMVQFYHETKIESKSYQGIKVLLLGDKGCGKTSLAQSLVDQQTRLMESDDSTLGIDIYDIIFETEEMDQDSKPLNISLWDFSGDQYFNFLNYPFLRLPSLAVIAVKLPGYKKETFKERIGTWLDLLIVRNNRLVVLLVGTQVDLLSQEEAKAKMAAVLEDSRNYLKTYMDDIDAQVHKIETQSQISSAQSELVRHYHELKEIRILMHDEAIETSAKSYNGFKEFEKATVDICTKSSTFAQVMRVVPSLWTDVENFFEDRGPEDPLMTLDFYNGLIHNKFGLRSVALKIAEYLHDTGRAVWTQADPTLAKSIILAPGILLDCLRILFRPDLDSYLKSNLDPEEIRKRYLKGNNATRYNRVIDEFVKEGIVDPELLQAMWGRSLTSNQIGKMLQYVCDNLELAYPIGKRNKDGLHNLSPQALYGALGRRKKGQGEEAPEEPVTNDSKAEEKTKDPSPFADNAVPRVLIPLFRFVEAPVDGHKEDWSRLERAGGVIRPTIVFQRGMPAGFFARATVRYHNFEKFKMRYLAHWKDGVQMRNLQFPVILRIVRGEHPDGSTLIRFEAAFDPILATSMKIDFTDTPERRAEFIWTCMFPVLRDFEDLLLQYPGVWYRRLMQCSPCNELSFMGEWLTPKEIQSQTSKTCQACGASVSTIYLAPPKEKRKVTTGDEIQKLKQQVMKKRAEENAARQKTGKDLLSVTDRGRPSESRRHSKRRISEASDVSTSRSRSRRGEEASEERATTKDKDGPRKSQVGFTDENGTLDSGLAVLGIE